MRQYFVEFERNTYLPQDTPGHGFDGWLTMALADPTAYFEGQENRLDIIRRLAVSLGYDEDETLERMSVDPNSLDPERDSQTGLFGFPFHNTPLGNRTNANLLLDATLRAGYDLTLQLESLVTKVLFDESEESPRAIGVEYMRGRSLYRADPRSSASADEPQKQRVYAKNGVIVSGGVFNTPQILKLSGIGPADELNALDIPVVVDLPGVGRRLQDDYEISIAAYASVNLSEPEPPGSPECTLGVGDDPCIELWEEGQGPYATPGSPYATHFRSSVAQNGERDVVMWNPPDVFRGFFPGYSRPQGDPATTFSFAMVHSQSRNHKGGSVTLRTSDPRDVPDIFFDFWAEGAEEDLQALYDGIEFARGVLANVDEPVGPFEEFQPCIGPIGTNCLEAATKDFVRRQVYSHHASSTAAIGSDDDPLAVLDGRFRVRGVQSLYVSDGSALPRPPSPFPIVGQYMAAYKAAEAVLEDAP